MPDGDLPMANTIGILLFDGAEEMDFVGPWQVLTAAIEDMSRERVLTVAHRIAPIVCEMGMRVIPDHSYRDVPALDVVLVPGGSGARREISNPATTDWLRSTAARCSWITSVCTGAFLLVGTGLTQGRRVTTHHQFLKQLREMGGADVIEGVRFVRDGNLVTAGGVMSGIEMSLWLVEQLYGAAAVGKTKSYIAYDYPPRNQSEAI
jgi:transcriptional regulator GlxA family with amidase domain